MIPKRIFQTWKTKDANNSIDKLRSSWIEKNPEFEYVYFDDKDILDFISLNFDERVNKCYKRMINGSLKADFFRYCVIYIQGGLYVDVDISCEKPLHEMFDFDKINFITATDNCRVHRSDRIYQGFLGGEAGCLIFKMMIDHVCSNIEQNKLKNNLFDLSGPVIFSKKLKEYMNKNVASTEKCNFLKELTYVNPITKEKFVIVQHDISKEKIQMNNVVFATAQHRIDRKNNPHYFKNRSQFRRGYYE